MKIFHQITSIWCQATSRANFWKKLISFIFCGYLSFLWNGLYRIIFTTLSGKMIISEPDCILCSILRISSPHYFDCFDCTHHILVKSLFQVVEKAFASSSILSHVLLHYQKVYKNELPCAILNGCNLVSRELKKIKFKQSRLNH